VPFILVQAGKRTTKYKLKQQKNTETKHNPKHSRTKLPWFSHLLRQSATKRGGIFFNAPSPHRALKQGTKVNNRIKPENSQVKWNGA